MQLSRHNLETLAYKYKRIVVYSYFAYKDVKTTEHDSCIYGYLTHFICDKATQTAQKN